MCPVALGATMSAPRPSCRNETPLRPPATKRQPINGEPRKFSNLEWLDFVYPDNEDLPYMYNEFAWDDCA